MGSLFLWATPALRADVFTWKATAGGAWGDGNNWNPMGSFPNAPGDVAIFPTPAVNPMGNNQTVTLNVPPRLTVGQIDFNHFASYTIAAAGANLRLDSTSGAAQVNVLQGSHTIAAPITLKDDLIVDTAANTTLTFSGGLADVDGSRALTKRGQGTLIFAGGNYSGRLGATTVEEGSLKVVGVNMFHSDVTVRSGATFQGTGIVGNVTAEGEPIQAALQSNSTLGAFQVSIQQEAPPRGRGGTIIIGLSPGILNTTNLILEPGSNLEMELDGSSNPPTPGLHYDQVVVAGNTVQLDDAFLILSLGPDYMHVQGRMFTLIDFAADPGMFSVMGRFVDRPEGDPFAVDGKFFKITYAGGDGNDVVLTAVGAPGPGVIPEPSSLVLLGLGSLSLAGYAYGRRKQTA